MPKLPIKAATLLLTVSLLAAGCGQNRKGAEIQPTPTPAATAEVKKPAADSEKQQSAKAYYANQDGTALVEKQQTIRYTTDASKYLAALNLLKTPQDDSVVVLCKGFTFKTPVVDSGNVKVDLTFGSDDQLGAEGELLIMQAIEKSLFQFDEVKTVDLLVNGKQTDSLMGHVELKHPIQREDVK